ncbi:hypothetical protein HK100_008250, partial [Physocladia obscura]
MEYEARVPYPKTRETPPPGSLSAKNLPPPPKSHKQMLMHNYANYFVEAETAELNALHRKNVWIKRKRPKKRKLLCSKWVYTYKIGTTSDTVICFKVRLVAMGITQTQ